MTVQQQQYAQPSANGQAQLYPQLRPAGFTSLIFGDPKAGKSNLGDSGPQPRLIVDVEGETEWTASRKIAWNPAHPPPPPPGMRLVAGYGQPSRVPEWETALAVVRDAQDIHRIYTVLNAGHHPFNSVSVDSVTEFQQRIIDGRVGMKQMQWDDWNALLRQSMWSVRQWRDLVHHPVRPLWTVTFVAGMSLDRSTGKYRPLMQGAGRDYIGYHVSVEGFLDVQPDGTRLLWIDPIPSCKVTTKDGIKDIPGYETGNRLAGILPSPMPIAYPGRPGWTLESMAAHVIAARQ